MNRRRFLGLLASAFLVGFRKSFALPLPARRLDLDHPLADPFCIRWNDYYYLTGTYSTGRPGNTGRAFDLLRSKNLEEWDSLGPMLQIPEYDGSRQANYWAPEILPHEDKYYLYYTSDSFGDPYRRFVRVAVSESIEGPYQSEGRPLTAYPSIDGHPLFLSEQEGYLFYTGNEGNPHMGQLLFDRLISPTLLAGNPKKVFPDETVDWEEGSFILRHDEAFYLFSSQGNWRNETYHILVARSDSILGPWVRISDRKDRSVLQSTQSQIGPGHNSLFEGPDQQTFICYHAWDPEHTGRYAWIAPIEWIDGLPQVAELDQ